MPLNDHAVDTSQSLVPLKAPILRGSSLYHRRWRFFIIPGPHDLHPNNSPPQNNKTPLSRGSVYVLPITIKR